MNSNAEHIEYITESLSSMNDESLRLLRGLAQVLRRDRVTKPDSAASILADSSNTITEMLAYIAINANKQVAATRLLVDFLAD